MDRKIRVGAVNYLNTLPLIYGLQRGTIAERIELMTEYPSKVAGSLIDDTIDIGLVPIAILPRLKEYHIIPGYCIGASKPVASVCLFSDVPVDQVSRILLDYQSRSSVALLKILLKEYWKVSPELVQAGEHYEKDISGTTAGLIIGDRALKHLHLNPYVYDLAQAWQHLTSLPFVFAAWVSNKELPESFIRQFSTATGEGLNHLSDIISEHAVGYYNLNTYYRENIDYVLDEPKYQAIYLFLSKISEF